MNPISGATAIYAILGDPVDQVRSPELANERFAARGVDAVLLPIRVAVADLGTVVDALKRIGNLRGWIVTVPHKIAAYAHCDRASPRAHRAGAVNVMARAHDGRWVGDLLDGVGCVRGLECAGATVRGTRAALIGAGGAGRAIAFALAEAGVSSLAIIDRDDMRASELARAVAGAHAGVDARTCLEDPTAIDLVVHATPLGMASGDPLPLDPATLAPTAWVVDIVMKPATTPLLAAARSRGLRTVPGSATLEGQIDALVDFLLAPPCLVHEGSIPEG